MKNTILSLFVIALFTITAQAQNKAIHLGAEVTHYIDFYDNSFVAPTLAIETAMNRKFALHAQVSYGNSSDFNRFNEKVHLRAFSVNPEVRFYPKEALRGFFLASGLSYSTFSAHIKGENDKIELVIDDRYKDSSFLEFKIGYQAQITDDFNLSAEGYLGPSLKGEGTIGGFSFALGYTF